MMTLFESIFLFLKGLGAGGHKVKQMTLSD
jgi:hypothetical protein